MGLESMRIVTGCKTPEQFVALFHRFCDAKSCFIPTTDTRPVGSTLAFSLRLADGTSMLRGMCLVTASWNDKDNAFKRPGVKLEIQKLTPDSVDVFEQLLDQKVTDGTVQEVVRLDTNQHVPREQAMSLLLRAGLAKPVIDDKATIEMPPLFTPETRTPGSSIVLPANPLSDVDEATLDALLSCSMTEDASDHADAMPVAEAVQARAEMRTLLGVAPLTAAIVQPVQPILDSPTRPLPSMSFRLRAISEAIVPLLRPTPRAARTTASTRPLALHAMTAHERTWFLAAFGAVLLLAALVLGSAVVSAG
jgi:hypothetical protein